MERHICALCGRERREKALTCPRCHELYRKEAPGLILQGKVLEFGEWVEEKVKEKLAEFQPLQEELEQKKEEFNAFQNEVREAAYQDLRKRVGDKKISKEIFDASLKELRQQMWKAKGGNELFAEMKRLEEEVREKTSALHETMAMIKKMKQGKTTQAEVNQLIESVQKPRPKKD